MEFAGDDVIEDVEEAADTGDDVVEDVDEAAVAETISLRTSRRSRRANAAQKTLDHPRAGSKDASGVMETPLTRLPLHDGQHG